MGPGKRRDREEQFMQKTVVALVIIGLVWVSYTAWPLFELTALVRAIDARDLATVAQHVNFDRVRLSITEQVVAAYVRRSGIKPGLFAQQAIVVALSIADPVVRISFGAHIGFGARRCRHASSRTNGRAN
jgi:hypothetical protein